MTDDEQPLPLDACLGNQQSLERFQRDVQLLVIEFQDPVRR